MNCNMPVFFIRAAAIITLGTALYEALPYFGLDSLWAVGPALRDKEWWLIAWFSLAFLFSTILPVAKLCAAIGLIGFRHWAWWAAVVSLSADLLLRLMGAINIAIQSYRYRDFKIPESSYVVVYISMWPSYIIAFLCALAIFILLRPNIKRSFCTVVKQQKTGPDD